MRHLPCESAEQLLEFTMCISTSKKYVPACLELVSRPVEGKLTRIIQISFLVPEKEGSGGIFIPARELMLVTTWATGYLDVQRVDNGVSQAGRDRELLADVGTARC